MGTGDNPSQPSSPLSTPSMSKKASPKGLIILIVAIFTLASGGIFLLQQNEKKNSENRLEQGKQQGQEQFRSALSSPIAPYTLIYGDWDGQKSNIKSVNLSTGKFKTIAALPSDVKKINLLSSNQLLYIDQTDQQDHGKQLAIASLSDGKTKSSVTADRGFGIDDYVLSKNKQYVATWEVSFQPGSTVLMGGRSRVYATALANPGSKHLLYDENVDGPVHYPLAILDDGKVFLDKFQANDPNGSTGWAYGMSVSSLDGKEKQDLSQMRNGTYGTQPILSPDGKDLVFAGYDGAFGPGTKIVNGYRQSILTPNTVELLNVTTLQRQKLPNLPNTSSYISAYWNNQNGDIFYTAIDKSSSGSFVYNLATKTTTPLDYLSAKDGSTASFVGDLQSGKVLLGVTDRSPSSLGNLGNSYASSYTKFYVQDSNNSTPIELNLPDAFMQYIMLVPNEEISFETMTVASASNPDEKNKNDMVQLRDFFLKADLGENRQSQQADPAECKAPGPSGTAPSGPALRVNVAVASPAISGGPNKGPACQPDDGKKGKCNETIGIPQCLAKGLKKPSPEYMKCVVDVDEEARKKGQCFDSPLYLYGNAGENIKVKVNTGVYSSGPAYEDGYDITLSEQGGMYVGGKLYSSIEYDYNPGVLKISPPTRGLVVSQNDVAKTLTEYAKRLGLNEKETSDLLAFGQNKVNSPYAYISFFDQATSEKILPLSFSRKPDNYLNVVFYVKLLKSRGDFTPTPPAFGTPVKRTGFTAVEVSELVE